MEWVPLLFSLMFFLAALIYLYWGINIIRTNPKERLNKAFLALSLALFVWTISYALNNSAQNIETALFWRRVGSVGRIYLFAIILHFMLLLTQKKDDFTEKWLMLLIYVPTVILVYVFSISKTMAPLQYNLLQISYGWVDKPVDNIWNKMFYFYFILYILTSLAIVWRWKKKLKNETVNRQASLIMKTIVVAIVFGGLLDIIPSLILEKPLPQLTSIVILIPVYAMYHAAKHYELFNAEISSKEEIVVTSEEQKNIFTNIARAFYLAALLAFLSEYLPLIGKEDAFKNALLKGVIVFSIGILISLIQNIKKEDLKENLTIIVIVFSIPICLFMFLKYGSVTVWAFPMIIIISSIVFSKRILLFSTAIVSIITQILIWAFRPEVAVSLDRYDYILRIGMLIVVFFIGLYTNKIYVSKIKDNNRQIAFQEMTSEILFDFVDIKQENFNDKINKLLTEMGKFFKVDRIYLFKINDHNETMTYSNEWHNSGISSEVGSIEEIPLEVFPWWIDQLNKNKLVYIEDLDLMPAEAISEKEQLQRQNVKSLISVPVLVEDKMHAFIGMDAVRSNKNWSEEEIKQLKIMANVAANALIQLSSDQEIEFMAYYDNLTGLPNRFLFKDRVESALSLAVRNEKFISIMFIDLDNFKSVNDTLGHEGGDSLLKEVAKGLSSRVRKTDTVARFGGDEFMIMLNDIDNHKDIPKIADNIMDLFSKSFIIDEQEFFITGSGGIATFPIDGENSETLVKNADIAMYQAKDKGKNGYSLCTPEMKDEVKKNMKLSNDLYRALERNELSVYYQPQINLINKEITGLEALLRWKHPEYGMISPVVFIPLAEKSSLINSIGEWVLKTACAQNKKWQDMGLANLQIAVNLSGIQFINSHIADDIDRILRETKLEAKYLELEITESIAIKETDFVIDVLSKLKKIGVSIAIDDFGTEYSSLSRLKKLPIDRIKIDMEFISGIENNQKDQAITMIIINLAKSLGMNVLAEGVETAPQLEFLNQKMCDYVQGYYYYKPMPVEEMEKILMAFKDLDKSFIPEDFFQPVYS